MDAPLPQLPEEIRRTEMRTATLIRRGQDLVQNIRLLTSNASLYLLGLAFIIYLFSLLQGCLEFILVSLIGLLYVHISLHRLFLEDQTAVCFFMTLGAIGTLRLKLNTLTEEEFSTADEFLVHQLKDRQKIRKLDKLYLIIVELFCIYQLLKHISEPFASFSAPLVPQAFKPYL
jgi:hypothetical protein